MGVPRRKLLAATPTLVLLPGCISVGAPSRGVLEFVTDSEQQYSADVLVTDASTTVCSEAVSFDASDSADVSFELPGEGTVDVEIEFDADLLRLEFGDDVDDDDWTLTETIVRGRVGANSSDQRYRFRVDRTGAVRLTRNSVHAV